MERLDDIAERIRADFSARDEVRDEALRQSREVIRFCATAIRSVHRDEREKAREIIGQADSVAAEMVGALEPYPDLLYAGYTQDALKELVEAHLTFDMVTGSPLTEPEALGVWVSSSAYLGGLCEAASELRRRCLDLLRRGRTEEAERLLSLMDTAYATLTTFDFPDAITHGLRRRVDQLRGVLERTRGDLTQALRQDRLMEALSRFENQILEAD
jgi:translin